MDLFEEKYRAGQFSEHIGIKAHNLKDWRNRGIDIGLGVAVNSEKRYSDYDRFEVQLMRLLAKEHFDRMRDALEDARLLSLHILKKLGVDVTVPRTKLPPSPYFEFYLHEPVSTKYLLVDVLRKKVLTDDPTAAMRDWPNPRGRTVVYDCDYYAEKLRPWVVENLSDYIVG